MKFDLDLSIEVLSKTPGVLSNLLGGLSDSWLKTNEGPDTWSPYDIVGHLIHGEKTDWIPRLKICLRFEGDNRQFQPFDRFAQFNESPGQSTGQLLDEFARLRKENLDYLRSLKLSENDLAMTGIHPAFGEVTVAQLLSTWTVHDLNHIYQCTRVMAKQYKQEVGPWIQYLRVLQE